MYVLGREGLGTRPAPLGEQSESFVLIDVIEALTLASVYTLINLRY